MRAVLFVLVGTTVAIGAMGCIANDVARIPDTGLPPRDSTVHSVSVSPSPATVRIGETIQLAAAVDAGAGVTLRTVAWSSSDTAIAFVSNAGLVAPRAVTGTVTITARSNADTSVKGSSVVTVGAAVSTGAP